MCVSSKKIMDLRATVIATVMNSTMDLLDKKKNQAVKSNGTSSTSANTLVRTRNQKNSTISSLLPIPESSQMLISSTLVSPKDHPYIDLSVKKRIIFKTRPTTALLRPNE
jgi:hypothetical protein